MSFEKPPVSGVRRTKKISFEDNLRSFNQRNPAHTSRKAQSEAILQNQQKYPKQISLARGFAMTTTRWASEMYRLTDSSSMPAGLDKDDWSDSDYDLTEDEESESDLSNRMDGFLALQAPLDKPHSSDEIEATMSTPCLKNSTAKIDSNNNVVVETEKEKRRKKPKKKEPEPMLMEPVITPKNIASSFLNIPVELKTLCLVDLCTWAALCTFLIYYTGMLCFN